jgi:hypothetical protein
MTGSRLYLFVFNKPCLSLCSRVGQHRRAVGIGSCELLGARGKGRDVCRFALRYSSSSPGLFLQFSEYEHSLISRDPFLSFLVDIASDIAFPKQEKKSGVYYRGPLTRPRDLKGSDPTEFDLNPYPIRWFNWVDK